MGAIFRNNQDGGKQTEGPSDGGPGRQPNKKKKGKKGPRDSSLVTAAERRGQKVPSPDGTGLFDKMLDEPCPYHKGPVKHTF